MYCGKCGYEIKKEGKYCPRCGNLLERGWNVEEAAGNVRNVSVKKQYKKRITHRDQVGLIKSMHEGFNIQKSINVIHCISRLKKKPT